MAFRTRPLSSRHSWHELRGYYLKHSLQAAAAKCWNRIIRRYKAFQSDSSTG